MPINDWQFWVVTIIALGALWVLKGVLVPKKRKGKKTTLTVGGQPVQKRKTKSDDCGCG